MTDDLLSKIHDNPVLSEAFSDPALGQVLAQLQSNPQAVAAAAKDNPKVSQTEPKQMDLLLLTPVRQLIKNILIFFSAALCIMSIYILLKRHYSVIGSSHAIVTSMLKIISIDSKVCSRVLCSHG